MGHLVAVLSELKLAKPPLGVKRTIRGTCVGSDLKASATTTQTFCQLFLRLITRSRQISSWYRGRTPQMRVAAVALFAKSVVLPFYFAMSWCSITLYIIFLQTKSSHNLKIDRQILVCLYICLKSKLRSCSRIIATSFLGLQKGFVESLPLPSALNIHHDISASSIFNS